MTTLAELAEPLELYQLAVQEPAAEVMFLEQAFQTLTGHRARTLREDFCGTAAICRAWCARSTDNSAWGIDRDRYTLNWGRHHIMLTAGQEIAERIQLIAGDVRSARTPPVDLVAALNFSYRLLRKRDELLDYLKAVAAALQPDGLFVLDVYGGHDTLRPCIEERPFAHPRLGTVTYLWEQYDYEPISDCMPCAIHFRFTDNSSLERAFVYDWRCWTLAELREALTEAGLGRITTYWQGWTNTEEPDGRFKPVTTGRNDAAWIAYIAARH